ncbi:TadE/TadG family type IV pilus assembly protein [Pelagibius sp. Alg239-R121]|uniref:TadE/TadG family type IV pilus assembly protein n=1 Tax=Pelagibius sp. Alg239-R121 TaxID=2993448 RepID=UPI0024A75EE7|nr:TadE/TadG family type IV pilus assembly protein [Pelagibius sp. Alg239-R121]
MSIMPQTKQLIHQFTRARDGIAAAEFALILPAFLLMLFGTLEVAMVMFTLSLAEGGLREAARFGVTGQEPDPAKRQEKILEIVEQHTHGLIEISDANVTMTVYPDFTGDDTGPGTPGAGDANDVVFYRLDYEWEFMTPVFAVFGGPDGNLPMSATVAVRNEPYSEE